MSFIPLDTKSFLVLIAKAIKLIIECLIELMSDNVRVMSDQVARVEADPETPVISISGEEMNRASWIETTRQEIDKRNIIIQKLTDVLAKLEK